MEGYSYFVLIIVLVNSFTLFFTLALYKAGRIRQVCWCLPYGTCQELSYSKFKKESPEDCNVHGRLKKAKRVQSCCTYSLIFRIIMYFKYGKLIFFMGIQQKRYIYTAEKRELLQMNALDKDGEKFVVCDTFVSLPKLMM